MLDMYIVIGDVLVDRLLPVSIENLSLESFLGIFVLAKFSNIFFNHQLEPFLHCRIICSVISHMLVANFLQPQLSNFAQPIGEVVARASLQVIPEIWRSLSNLLTVQIVLSTLVVSHTHTSVVFFRNFTWRLRPAPTAWVKWTSILCFSPLLQSKDSS